MFANVIVDIAHTNIDRTFAYEIPSGMEVLPGQRVMAPFGRGNRPTEAFVLSITDECNFEDNTPKTLKPLLRTLEGFALLRADKLALAGWISEKYGCLLVEALRLMLPANVHAGKPKTQSHLRINVQGGAFEAAKRALYSKGGKLTSPRQLEILELLRGYTELPKSSVLEFLPGSQSAIAALIKKGHIALRAHESYRRPYGKLGSEKDAPPKLLPEQKIAVDAITGALGTHKTFLLHGVTGSGKTEVYMRAIDACLARGDAAIVLVPEISLTPQAVERFRARFGDAVAVLHSRLSLGERFDEWRRARMGEVKVVVGARSAIFAPLERIGIIIIDEEHEQSYRSEMNPRYSATEVAKRICEVSNAPLVLGSATPGLESYHRAKNGGIELLELSERVNRQPLPKVELVDMRDEIRRGNKSVFSERLHEALESCIAVGNQAILFINRRGYSTFVSCRACGYVLGCDTCDVSLTYHKYENTGRCHYCGREKRIPKNCPECGSPYLKYFGAGTEQVEEAFKKLFDGVPTLRMDLDTTGRKDAHAQILAKFAAREAQVLIGTQMVAKGLDFPNVTLVGVMAADASLYIPDYRSAERTFQLITQVAGRAGRDAAAGSVIVQTYSPGHPSIKHAAQQDYKAFYDYEIGQRQKAQFPPFTVFVRVLLTGDDEQALDSAARGLAKELETLIRNGHATELVEIAASSAPVKRINQKHRFQVLLKLQNTPRTGEIIALIQAHVRLKRPENLYHVEINPQNML